MRRSWTSDLRAARLPPSSRTSVPMPTPSTSAASWSRPASSRPTSTSTSRASWTVAHPPRGVPATTWSGCPRSSPGSRSRMCTPGPPRRWSSAFSTGRRMFEPTWRWTRTSGFGPSRRSSSSRPTMPGPSIWSFASSRRKAGPTCRRPTGTWSRRSNGVPPSWAARPGTTRTARVRSGASSSSRLSLTGTWTSISTSAPVPTKWTSTSSAS